MLKCKTVLSERLVCKQWVSVTMANVIDKLHRAIAWEIDICLRTVQEANYYF